MPRLPDRPGELTADLLGAVMGPHLDGAVIAEVRVIEAAEGTNRRARVQLSYARGTGPERVFVKWHGPLLNRLALLALRAHDAEARLVASDIALPVASPRFYGATRAPARLGSIVVMEDITAAGGRPNDARRALPLDEVASGLGGLAALHAEWWDRPLPAALDFCRPWHLGRAYAPISAASLARGLAKARRGGLELASQASARRLERQFRAHALWAARGPQCLLHGDPHPGNTYRTAQGATGFYDWQLVRRGNAAHDVSYFMISSLAPADRRQDERALLNHYRRALIEAGVSAPSEAELWRCHVAAPAFGLSTWLHTLAFGRFQDDEVSYATISRFAAAYRDLESWRDPA